VSVWGLPQLDATFYESKSNTVAIRLTGYPSRSGVIAGLLSGANPVSVRGPFGHVRLPPGAGRSPG
jgi:hypothetical protein